jgi:nitroreductase
LTQAEKTGSQAISDLIKSRRTVRAFTGQPVSDETLAELVDAAVWAPNHRMTEPWRFYILRKSGETRRKVAELAYEWTLANTLNPNPERAISSAEAVRKELLEAPAVVYVYSLLGDNAEIAEENYSATSCAIQNLMLAAHARGLGVGWSTGKPARHEKLAGTLGAGGASRLVACLFIGHPSAIPEGRRKEASAVTSWL